MSHYSSDEEEVHGGQKYEDEEEYDNHRVVEEEEEEEDVYVDEEQDDEDLKKHKSKKRSSKRKKRKSGSSEKSMDLDDPEVYVRWLWERLFLWKQPIKSAMAFGMICLTFALIHMSEYTFVTLFCFLLLFQLTTIVLASQFTPQMQQKGMVKKGFNPERFAARRQLLSGADLEKVTRGSAMIAADIVEQWEAIMMDEEENVRFVMLVVLLGCLAAVGFYVETYMVNFALAASCFVLPPYYKMNQKAFDGLYGTIYDFIDAFVNHE